MNIELVLRLRVLDEDMVPEATSQPLSVKYVEVLSDDDVTGAREEFEYVMDRMALGLWDALAKRL